jgi:hypothetical protein
MELLAFVFRLSKEQFSDPPDRLAEIGDKPLALPPSETRL